HRPRLPPGDPREADRRGHGQVWTRTCRARRELLHLPLSRRDPRPREGARAPVRRARAARAPHRGQPVPRRRGDRTPSGRPHRRPPARPRGARGEPIDLSRIPLDDRTVYDEIQGADTVGVFQIESRAQMQMLLRTRPENLDDLTIEVALVRPGPIQGGAVHPYIERRQKLRENPDYRVEYDHPLLEEPLRETLGVVVFQDQVLEVAMALAGFSVG